MAMMTGQAGLPVLNLARQYTHKAAKVSSLIIIYFYLNRCLSLVDIFVKPSLGMETDFTYLVWFS